MSWEHVLSVCEPLRVRLGHSLEFEVGLGLISVVLWCGVHPPWAPAGEARRREVGGCVKATPASQ